LYGLLRTYPYRAMPSPN